MKPSFRWIFGLTTLAVALCLSGCVAAIGNETPGRTRVSLGQELIDLQRAKEVGALSESEYQSQKAKLLGSK